MCVCAVQEWENFFNDTKSQEDAGCSTCLDFQRQIAQARVSVHKTKTENNAIRRQKGVN